jgi:hypothetical protein
LIEETQPPKGFPITAELALSNHRQQIGSTIFLAKRRVTVQKPYLYRIEVETTWDAADRPLVLSLTRYNPAGPEP